MTLEEVYNGKSSKIAINRNRINPEAKEKGEQVCPHCKGRGMVTKMTMLGPGMYSQQTVPCEHCGGSGTSLSDKDMYKERKVIEVQVDKGAPHGEKYIFHGESDEYPGKEPGDVVIVVDEQPHKVFKRKGADLLMEKEISLLESLTGCDFVITHLDGKKYRIKSAPGQVIKPDTLMTLEEKGLPFHKTPYEFGNLFVMFRVKFPEKLDDAQVGKIKEALKGSAAKRDDDDMPDETCVLKPYHESQKNAHATGQEADDDEEDDDMPRGQRVQCA